MYRTDVRAFPVSLRRPDTILALAAALFVITWPLEKRHLIFTPYSFVTGAYTEAGTIALYVSDIAFLFLGAAWFWRAFRGLRNPHAENPWSLPISHSAFWVGVGFVCWAAFRALPLATSALGWYAALRIAQGFLLFLMAADLWKVPRVRTAIVSTLLLVGVFQALLGSVQVIKGGDLGLTFLGEQKLSLQKPGVAKVDLDPSSPGVPTLLEELQTNVSSGTETNVSIGTGSKSILLEELQTNVSIGTGSKSIIETVEHRKEEKNVPLGTKLLRAYGTFPHPNVLGGFLSLVIFYEIYSVFSQIRQKQRIAAWLYSIMFLLTFLGAILTFSRSSWLSITFGFVGLVCFYRNIDRLRHIVLLSLIAALILLAVSSFSPLGTGIYRRFLPPKSDMFLEERIEILRETSKVIPKNLFIGVGTGNGLISLVQADKSKCSPTGKYGSAQGERPSLSSRAPAWRARGTLPRSSASAPQGLRRTPCPLGRSTRSGHLSLGAFSSVSSYEKSVDFNTKDVIIYKPTAPWQYQNPHNVLVVILLEIGLVGLILAGAFVLQVLKPSVHRVTTKNQRWGLVCVLLFGAAALTPLLLDHYLWTTQQGRILLWGLLGVLASAERHPSGTTERAPLAHEPPATR